MISRTATELAEALGLELRGDGSATIDGLATLDAAVPGELSFYAGGRHRDAFLRTRASAVIVPPGAEREGPALLVAPEPRRAFARAVALLHPERRPAAGIEAGALVSPGARVAASATVRGGAIVEAGAVVGERSVIHPGAYVGPDVRIGADCLLHANTTVREGCVLGDRVVLQPGCVVGADGFGYLAGPDGPEKVRQVGIAVLEDDVEVGACATIDRATVGRTVIGRGTKIDNLVQVAHNVHVGEGCLLVAQVGVAGSAVIGDGVVLAGQVGVADGVSVGAGARVGGQGAVTGDVPAGAEVAGVSLMPLRRWLRVKALLRRLPDLHRDLRELARRVRALESEEE